MVQFTQVTFETHILTIRNWRGHFVRKNSYCPFVLWYGQLLIFRCLLKFLIQRLCSLLFPQHLTFKQLFQICFYPFVYSHTNWYLYSLDSFMRTRYMYYSKSPFTLFLIFPLIFPVKINSFNILPLPKRLISLIILLMISGTDHL